MTSPAPAMRRDAMLPRAGSDARRLAVAAGALLLFVAVWTVFHAISHGAHAINDDTAEAYVWGEQFEWGYWKHPPFWAWIAGLWFDVFPRNVWSLSLLATSCSAVGLIGAWKLNGCFLSGSARAAATVLLLLTPLYTFLGFKYNANSIFLPLWPWTAYFFVRSIQRGDTTSAVLFGVMAGIDMLSKYYAALLLVTCLVAALVHPGRARYFRSARPWISAGVALAVFVPHVVWLVQNGYPTFHYFGGETGQGFTFLLRQSLSLVGESIGYCLLAGLVVMAATRTTPQSWRARLGTLRHDENFQFLFALALMPALLTLVCSLLFRVTISSNTLIGVFCLMPVVFLELAQPFDAKKLLRIALISAGLVACLGLLAAPVIARHGTRDLKVHQYLVKRMERLWARTTDAPLVYVTGAEPFAEESAFYLHARPHEFIGFSFAHAPWVSRMSLAQRGFAAICPAENRWCIAQAHRFAPGVTQEETIAPLRALGGGKKSRESFVLIAAAPAAGKAAE